MLKPRSDGNDKTREKSLILSISIILLFLSFPAFSQNRFAITDQYAASAAANPSGVEDLYTQLIKNTKSDLEKVRAFYTWIAYNIKYDMKSYLADTVPPYEVDYTIKHKEGVCMGMAVLLDTLCKKAKIPCYLVDGYSKGMGYVEGQKLSVPEHIWNAVKLNNTWYLLDVTWDCTSTNRPDYFPDRKFKGKYFLMPSNEFLSKHLPADPVWQLSDYTVPISDFEKASENAVKLDPPKKKKISHLDSIGTLLKLDSTEAAYIYARRANDYNPRNSEAKIMLGLALFDKGYAAANALSKVSVQDYDKQYKQYETKINFYYEQAFAILSEVKRGMKYYDEAKEAADIIDSYKINTDIHNVTTTEANYKTNKSFSAIVLKKEFKCDIHPLKAVNSEFRETNVNISPDGNTLMFISDRGGQPWSTKREIGFRNKTSYDGDIWCSKKVNGSFGAPVCLDKTINTAGGEDEPNISPDGKKIVYQSWKDDWMSTGGPYYIADRDKNGFKNVKGLGDGIGRFFAHASNSNSGYATDGASMSPDGKRFIVSCGVDYDKDLDLYISDKDKNDHWTLLKPLPFNTKKDERSIFIAADGKTIFFASDGYGGFGGLDIFKTTIDEKGNIGEIINLGDKINTKGDDYSFILSGSGKEAYFVRDGDIYEALFSEPVPELMPGRSLVIKGTITHNYDTELSFQLKFTDEKNKLEHRALSDKDNANAYYLFLNSCKSKDITITVYNGSIEVAKEIVHPDTTLNYSEIIKNFNLHIDKKKEVKNDSSIQRVRVRDDIYENGMFANINFDYDSYVIGNKYKARLDSVVDYLKGHKRAKLGIAGYCDIRGNHDYNMPLSMKRAKAVYTYLVQKGVDKNQLIVNAYASKNPLTLDATIEGGWLNRRVEFKIVNSFPE